MITLKRSLESCLTWPSFPSLKIALKAAPIAQDFTPLTNSKRLGGKLRVVGELRALTAEEFARAAARLRNPAPGSRIEAAKTFGVDLTLLIEQLRLTPEERARKLEDASEELEQVRGIARRRAG
jgi:hypothetical protein